MRMFKYACAFFCLALMPLQATNVLCAEKTQKAILLLEHEQPSAWTDLLKHGLERGGRDFNIDVETVIAPPGPGQRDIFRKAAENADLVIVASDNLHEALRDNAANYRRVKFGSVDAGIRAPNIMSVTFADEQAAFLAGVAAAMLTTCQDVPGVNDAKIIGWLSGMDTPAMRTLFNGFAEGAKLVDPEVRVIQALAGSFTDPGTAAQKSRWLADAGADVIAVAAGAASSGLYPLPGKAIAIELDKDNGRGLGAITKAADRAVYEIMASAASDKFRGKEIVIYDLSGKGVDFTGYGDFLARNPAAKDIGRRIDELRREFANGSIQLPSLRQRTLCDCLD